MRTLARRFVYSAVALMRSIKPSRLNCPVLTAVVCLQLLHQPHAAGSRGKSPARPRRKIYCPLAVTEAAALPVISCALCWSSSSASIASIAEFGH